MDSVTIKHMLLHEIGCSLNTEESSPPDSKKIPLENTCNNNLNNNMPQNSRRWSYSGNTSFVEPEILEDMGVSMLEDPVTNDESTKQLQSQVCIISPVSSGNNKKLRSKIYEHDSIEYHKEVHVNSNMNNGNVERTEPDSCIYDLAVFNSTENKSSNPSRARENFVKENTNASTDNAGLDQFCLYRRKRKPSIVGENKFNELSDEIILMILKWLPKKCLVRSMLVCRRWYQVARDEALWTRLDLGSKVLSEGTLGFILPRGVQILRLAQAEIADPIFYESNIQCDYFRDVYISRLQYLDLSMAVISPNGLATLLSKCRLLKNLSLEKCIINRACFKEIRHNTELEILNLTMCEDIDAVCIMDLVKLKCLTVLNMAWCCLDSMSVSLLCRTLPPSIKRLSVAGCRKTMNDTNVKDLLRRCPDIVELDLSDCAILTINSIHTLLNFSKLEHLSLSRCYSIPQSAYTRLAQMPSLLYLDIFGLMTDQVLKSLQDKYRKLDVNKFYYSSIARPTVGIRRTSIWGQRVRD
ncbi:S-phase kinase-associated protein 2 [Odontomachus brunneus]|uniref:S-phase kinase-associated protein 2 n=1 Tax=Odontomachus brunneus TaxID=486640 RepID=UPI0013F293AF|nr:S-phase kinase-associated protein 2 [Odontomachus brunneus]